jgi:hypothetical protein
MKIFMFPESYNLLRAELHDHHPSLWKKVQWFMAFDRELFIETMNKELKTKILFETDIDVLCKHYLELLQKKRIIILQ